MRRPGSGDTAKEVMENTQHAAVADNDHGVLLLRQPAANPDGKVGITFATGRHGPPFIGLSFFSSLRWAPPA